MLEPSAIVFYAENLALSTHFYQDLLGINPEESSPTFNRFRLTNGMGLGLKAKDSVEPTVDGKGGNELAFILANKEQVDTLFLAWQQKGIAIVQSPTLLSFGYAFLALDPDGNRLRVLSLGK